MKPLFIVALFALFFSGSCKKEEPELQLPPYTQEGKNVFACKINGEIFIAKGRSKCHFGVYTENRIILFANENTPKKADFGLRFVYSTEQTLHTLKNGYDSSAYIYIPVGGQILAETEFFTNAEHTGTIEVKYFQNNIIAGTFQFDATDGEGNIVHVTEGIFDLTK